MKFVFLAAGKGERLKPLTTGNSKSALPVAGKPLVLWTVEEAKKLGDVIIVCHESQKDVIEIAEKSGSKTVFQKEPLGTADAVRVCEQEIDDDFVVINGDCYISGEDLKKIVETEGSVIGVYSAESSKDFALVEVEDGKVKSLTEKPADDRKGFVNAGVYKFSKSVFSNIKNISKSERGEYEITDALNELSELKAVKIQSWMTVTHPWDLLELNKALLDKSGSFISEKAEIKKGVVIEDPVFIGDGAVVGPNCYIRKYSSVGKNCKIGQSVEVKNSIIMDGTRAAHLSYIADSIIGKNVNVGAGFISANLRLDENNIHMKIKGEPTDSGRQKLGVVVGNNTKIGIRVSVMPGKKINADVLVPSGVIIKNDVEETPNVSKMGKVI
jgi:UDP-N-acetylglucosamine diphosphorylase / glucose-1-phosphate thymidylyltransferase / UDP-N-acetylgalactosamine diphosphorylase / glucosamine-1-phosphate N-acetyltransferase / galactosamine-1-phosphate N-acetyltransferase